MTITRADILAELGLTPQWVRRVPPIAPANPARVVVPSITVDPMVAPAMCSEPSAAAATGVEPAIAPATRTETAPVSLQRVDVDAAPRAARIAALTWTDFAADVDACNACGLCRTRRRSVPGAGDTSAEWMFVGEAPGAEEDTRGEPFVGQAGRLLDNMLGAMGMARDRNVYIANVLKCRPPDNRPPAASEAAACRPYLARQIALLRPKIIVALGKSAAALLLGTDATIGSLRGRVHAYGGFPLIVTYHPAYLLRTPTDKAKVWEDLLLARRTVNAAADGDPGGVQSVA